METKQPRQELKEKRGLILAKEHSIRKISNNIWRVNSQSSPTKYHTVNLLPHGGSCTCSSWKNEKVKCKHIYAVEYIMKKNTEDPQNLEYPQIQRPTYEQNWRSYNIAQKKEKAEFMRILADLVAGINEEKYSFGRPKVPVSDIIYAMTFKVYSGLSGRRFTSDLQFAKEKNYVFEDIAYNTVFKYFKNETLTKYLIELVKISSSPLKEIEQDFAVDSTGFGTSQFQRWFSYKHGRDLRTRKWVKCHFMVGVKTNIVTSVKITTEFDADSPQLEELVNTTNELFEMKEISADKAYSSRENYEIINKVGSKAYIPFKKNATGRTKGSMLWRKAYHYFMANFDEFMEHYHKRSNVETTVFMIKSKFGDSVKSKIWPAQVNEVLCKIICHNICVIIQEMENLGISSEFIMPTNSSLPIK